MKCQYVERLSDINKILLSPEVIQVRGITDIPITGAIYIGCYEEDIVSLFVWYRQNTHFYVLKPFRRKSIEYFKASEELLPGGEMYCAIPEEMKKVINFAKKAGYQEIRKSEGKVIMSKYNG